MASTAIKERYDFGPVLGTGASGKVYKATRKEDGVIVAIKRVSLSRLPNSKAAEVTAEMELMEKLNHPNIVKIIEYASDKKDAYFVIEFMEHGSLTKMLKQLGSFPEEIVANHIRQALQGLQYLHENQIIHRDIKGDNLLMSKDMRVCIGDFGIARKADPNEGPGDDMDAMGTPFWMAPEVILMTDQTTACDIWSIACTIIELLTGEPPYGKLSAVAAIFHMVKEDHPPLPTGISDDLKEFLLLCFDKDINTRATAEQLLKHPWIVKNQSTPVEKEDLSNVRNSIQVYNARRPSVFAAAPPKIDEEERAIVQEQKEIEEVRKEVKEAKHVVIEEEDLNAKNKEQVLAIIEKLEKKLDVVSKRVAKNRYQEKSLIQLRSLYGKFLKEEKERLEVQLHWVQEALFSELKTEHDLKKHIYRLKATVYTPLVAINDSNDNSDQSYLSYRKGDTIFLLSKQSDDQLLAEHSLTKQHGKCKASDFTNIKKQRAETSLPEQIQPSAEEVLFTIENRSRKEKLGKVFGASGVEIDRILEGKPPSPARRSSSPTRASDGSINQIEKEATNVNKKLSFGLKFSRGNSQTDLKRHYSAPVILSEQPENPELTTLLADYPFVMQEERDFVQYGVLGVSNDKEKMQEKHVFLFTDVMIITRKKDKKGRTKFKLETQIPLYDARIVLLADNAVVWPPLDNNNNNNNPILPAAVPSNTNTSPALSSSSSSPGSGPNSAFQLIYKRITWTLVPQSDKIQKSWYKEIKSLIRRFQHERYSSQV